MHVGTMSSNGTNELLIFHRIWPISITQILQRWTQKSMRRKQLSSLPPGRYRMLRLDNIRQLSMHCKIMPLLPNLLAFPRSSLSFVIHTNGCTRTLFAGIRISMDAVDYLRHGQQLTASG